MAVLLLWLMVTAVKATAQKKKDIAAANNALSIIFFPSEDDVAFSKPFTRFLFQEPTTLHHGTAPGEMSPLVKLSPSHSNSPGNRHKCSKGSAATGSHTYILSSLLIFVHSIGWAP